MLILGGRPIREPVAWMGPFVMNTRDEVVQAFSDYQAGRLGTIPAVHNTPAALQVTRRTMPRSMTAPPIAATSRPRPPLVGDAVRDRRRASVGRRDVRNLRGRGAIARSSGSGPGHGEIAAMLYECLVVARIAPDGTG